MTATDTGAPLVSCVMPTRGRAVWALQAVDLFLRQDYPNCEFVIVEDGEPSLADQLPSDPRLRLDSTGAEHSVGELRNRGCDQARGEIIVCWDDDDWYGPERVSRQVEPILAGRADVTGLTGFSWLELGGWQAWEIRAEHRERLLFHGVHGGAIAYRTSLFREVRYADMHHGEDLDFITRLVDDAGVRLEPVEAHAFFVYVRHGGNTWRAESRYGGADSWQATTLPGLSASDLAFLRDRTTAGTSG